MQLELVQVGVDAAGQLFKVVLVDGGLLHVPAGQVLGQDVEEDIANDQISLFESVDPFTGEPVKKGK